MINPATTDDLIREAMSKFRAQRGSKLISVGKRSMRVRTAGERVLYLPNGQHVKVSTDDSGIATQVEEDEKLHAVVRPLNIKTKGRLQPPAGIFQNFGRPLPIRALTSIFKRPQ